jgi:GNAT superfamily N-acetyltransferase
MTAASIEKYAGPTPPPIDALVAAAETEGHGFVRRTVEEWASGANRFDAPNEVWFLAELDGAVTGMCGVNIDRHLYDPTVGRLRHLYVHPDHRSGGLGERLVDACLKHASGRFTTIRLRTPGEEADRFYDKLGFLRSASDTASHTKQPG